MAIYVIAFFGGWALWRLATGSPYLPSVLWIGWHAHLGVNSLLWLAIAFALAGWAVRLWGSSYLSSEVVWNRDAVQGALLVDGPFRFVRNPLYLGNDLQAIALGILATPIGWAMLVLGSALFTTALAAHEAAGLRARYGAVYDAYRRAVPAFIPRLTPAHVEGSVRGKPSLAAGMRAEVLTAACAMAMLAFALTHSIWLLWAVIIAGWIAQSVLRMSAQPESTSAA